MGGLWLNEGDSERVGGMVGGRGQGMSGGGGTARPTGVWHWVGRAARGLYRGRFGQFVAAAEVPEEGVVRGGPGRMAYLRWGRAGRPLVMIHGLDMNPWVWAQVAGLLSPGRTVVSLAQRGHGRSSAPSSGYSLEETTGDLLDLLDGLGFDDEVDLAGHSWGGKVACHAVAMAPERFRSLVLADPVPPRGLGGLSDRFPQVADSLLLPERGPFGDREALMARMRHLPHLCQGGEPDRQVWESCFRIQADGSYRHTLPDSGYRELLDETFPTDICSLLPRIVCPTLLLRPTLTIGAGPLAFRPLRRSLAKFREHRVSGDHSFIHTNPLDTAEVMGAFLTELG